jgi:hypothetical protein
MTKRPRARAFAPQVGFVPQRNMNDAPLAAVHRVEAERRSGALHLFRRSQRTQAQLFDAQRPVIVCVEGNARMIVGVKPQKFLRDEFKRQQKLGAVRQQQLDVVSAEFDKKIGILEIRIAAVA